MGDKGRCLENLSQKIQLITLAEIRRLFISKDVEAGAELLNRWEQYLHYSRHEKNPQSQETLNSTIESFSKRLGALQNVLNSLPKKESVVDLQAQLNVLEERFATTSIGVSGGTFEWVDSMLIKCLREGSWLVIDNVNLCSAAILDRLNGLLEPGGELVLGERGVDINGQLVRIKPHPNFRLFLVMDPRFGEISRAMRNRGVEICILDPEEKCSFMDLQAVLSQTGISLYNQQMALINIHEEMKKNTDGFDGITMNNLMQVAALTNQQTKRGRPFCASLFSACSDVYIHSRQLTVDQRERYSTWLSEILKQQQHLISPTIPDVKDALDIHSVTLRTLALQENSSLALLEQKCALLSAVLKVVSESSDCTLKDLVKGYRIDLEKMSLFDKHLTDIIPQVLLTTISCLSESDVCSKQNLILTKIMSCRNVENRNNLLELKSYLLSIVLEAVKSNKLSSVEGVRRKDLCWDLRRVSTWITGLKLYDYENKSVALLYYFMHYIQLNVKLGEIKTTSVKNMSALDFSTSFNKGKVTISSVNSKVVQDLSVFLEALEDQIHSLMECDGGLDEDQCCQLISAFHWSHRLLQVSQRKLFVGGTRNMQVSEELVMLLTLHINWIKKFLFPLLQRHNVHHSKRGKLNQLPSQLSEICSASSQTRPLRSLSKRVRTQLGQPPPLSNLLQGELTELINRLEEKTDIAETECSIRVIQKRVEFFMTAAGRNLRLKLAEGSNLIYTNHLLEEAISEFKMLQSSLEIDKVNCPEEKREFENQLCPSCCWEVSLWPVKSVICLHLMSAAQSSRSDQLVKVLSSMIQSLPCFPPRVLALFTGTGCSPLMTSTVLTNQLSGSLAVTNPRSWLAWVSTYQPDVDRSDNVSSIDDYSHMNESFSLQFPLLSLFTTSLLYPGYHTKGDPNLSTPPLHSQRQHIDLLNTLKHHIWTTSPALATNTLNYRKNEMKLLESSYKDLLTAMMQTAELKISMKELPSAEKQVFDILKDLIVTKKLPESYTSCQSKDVKRFLLDTANCITTLEDLLVKLHGEQTDGMKWMWIGHGWTQLGLMKIKLFAHQDYLDPVYKKTLKLQYCQQEREDLERSLAVEYAQGIILRSYQFPLGEAFSRRIDFLKTKEGEMKKFVAQRPQLNTYSQLFNEINQFLALIVNPSQRLEGITKSLFEIETDAPPQSVQHAVNQAKSLQASILMSLDNFDKKYSVWYPDVVVPVTSAISQISHGLHMMICAVRHWGANMVSPVEPLLRSLACFPLLDYSATLDLVDVCTSTRILDLLEKSAKSELKEQGFASNETFRLAKCSLQEVCNYVCVRGELWPKDWTTVCRILDYLVTVWQRQEAERVQKEQEENSFFINKARKVENLTEEEEDDFEMKKLFPTYRDKDFGDLDGPSLEQQKIDPETNDQPTLKLTINNILEINKIHSAIVTKHTKAHWITPTEPEQPEFGLPFSDRFNIFAVLLDSMYSGCENRLDVDLSSSLCYSVHLANESGTIYMQNKRKHYDFYSDPNITEIKLCIPILESLVKRVTELLKEWPDHPTLNQIILVVNRILDFPSLSPVSRFLVGLELLLTKLKEWEENAHSGVTLAPHAAAVTRQVLDWRKLEITQWRGCLESARIRLSEMAAGQWWFHLYSLVREGSTEANATDLATALEQFMEASNMAEFHTRLNLLYTFHCHCVNSKQNLESSILWNIHQYYSQFSHVITSRIKELSAPVEKKLRDFVKIARWNDINYWAVKETVSKTHRTLFKYIREYENILKQPALNAMTRLEPINQRALDLSVITTHFLASLTLAESLPEDSADGSSTGHLLNEQRALFKRARKLCRDFLTNCPLTQHISTLHETASELHETSQVLSNEEIDRSVNKEKQKSAARSLLHRKRMTLTDLFHMLSELGLSYRKGLVVVGAGSPSDSQFSLHAPLNVDAALAQIDDKLADKELKRVWNGCERLFLQCVAQLAQLQKSLRKPHKDLGPAIIERCSGFANHLMSMCHDQKKSLTNYLTSLYQLRSLIQHLETLQPAKIPVVGNTTQIKSDLLSVLDDITYGLTQFELLIDSCPQAPNMNETVGSNFETVLIPESAAIIIYKGDENWSKLKTKLSSIVKNVKKIKSMIKEKGKFLQLLDLLKHSSNHDSSKELPIIDDLQGLEDGCEHLKQLKNEIINIQQFFRMKVDGDSNPFSHILIHLEKKIETFLENVSCLELETPGCEQANDNSIESTIETLLNKVLFAIQELYKNTSTNKVVGDDIQPDNSASSLHLNDSIIAVLQNNLGILKLSDVTSGLMKTLTANKSQLQLSKRCVPLMQQYSLVAQFLVTQQLAALRTCAYFCSSLLNIFIDLANKGFRVPEELLEEEGDGADTMSGGLGMGEGEGEKDVSDQIESQDQLEDAKKPGEHDKDEDKDCKEEEKGIDMTDDFGGKLQDIEKKDDSDGSEDENENKEELDKEMGDTDKGAETLDQQIWGESDSEEEEDTGDNKEEQGDSGEQTSEKEMGAKDDKKNPQSEENEKNVEDQTEKKKEINEIDEPEVDDDQIDPYHGKNQPQPEPEPLDLPDDLQLDDGGNNDKEEGEEEDNPFDIDAMKEPKIQEEEEENAENNPEGADEGDNKESDPKKDDSSDEEDEGEGEGEGDDDDQLKDSMEIDDEEKNKEDQEAGGAKDENKTGEEQKMEEESKETEEAKPSEDLPALEPVPSSQQDSGSKDQVNQPERNEQSKELAPEEAGAEGPEERGVGAAQDKQESQRGGRGESQQAVQAQMPQTREEKRNRPGDSEEQRTLGDIQEPLKKKLKTINTEKLNDPNKDNHDMDEEGIKEDQNAELYQHIKEAKQSDHDAQVIDAATEEQASEQKLPNKEEEEAEELKDENDMTMEQDTQDIETEMTNNIKLEELKEARDDKKENRKQPSKEGEKMEGESNMEVEGDLISTMTVQRGADSAYYTKLDDGLDLLSPAFDCSAIRNELELQLATWTQPPANEEAVLAWERLCCVTADLSRDLSEQLRLVLEPTHASRLKGDFRTGRRINMRKVIPYIASQFRKDKIWLRRTKPAKREYQIVLAIDDSSSMADNNSKELAFESLAVVSKALGLLEAGQLCVLSFGERTEILHQLGDPFTEHSGAKLLQQFSFKQQKTQVATMVNFACSLFERNPVRRGVTDIAQLVLIVSDGRGVMNDGEESVRQAVRRAKHMGVFIVFVIVDNPQSKDSILDIRLPKFSGGKLLGIVPYMDSFPFPFYLILRDINKLPSVLSDALRQWFELVTTNS